MITDGPIILAAMVLFSQFKDVTPLVATLSLVGGLYLMWLASKILRIQDIRLSERLPRTSSLALAIKVNFLNPSPYLFWFTVGGSYIMLGSAVEATVFVVVAIGTLVMSKILVAAVAAMCRPLLDSRAYLFVMKALAVALAVFGALSVSKAYKLFYA
jgi:threonine/homoserine/homoserine lactone efflux protein